MDMGLQLIFLWFAHCIGDMALQNKFIAETKSRLPYSMFSHVFIWSATVSLPLLAFGIFSYAKFIFLMIGHWLIDHWKSNQPKDDAHFWCIYVDQMLHFVQIVICLVF